MTDEEPDSGAERDIGHAGDDAWPLQGVLESACLEDGCDWQDLTVLTSAHDPYRQDTPKGRSFTDWIITEIEKRFRPDQRIHIRGLHYALVQAGDVRKPDGGIYRNTVDDWEWLGRAVKPARWSGRLPFVRIVDQRNPDPKPHRHREPSAPLGRHLHAGVAWEDELSFGRPPSVSEPFAWLSGFTLEQPFCLVIFGEKSSLEDVLEPIAARYGADLYLAAGEISDTLIHQMAQDAAGDGRPLVVITVSDFDPAGRQMPVSIGRKLQAFRDMFFPELRFEVVPAALTLDQVRDNLLPSTPLKPNELRASTWREEFNHEQTEIDALLAPGREGVLRRIVEEAIAPYYDRTLASRIRQAEAQWDEEAQAAIDGHVDGDALDEIRQEVANIEAETAERIEAIKTEIADRVAAASARIEELVADVELPEAPNLPEIELPERPPGSVLVTTDWTWAEQSKALKGQKTYGGAEETKRATKRRASQRFREKQKAARTAGDNNEDEE